MAFIEMKHWGWNGSKSRTKCFQTALQCLTEDFMANVYSEPWPTPKMELFTKIVEGWKLLTIFAKSSIFDVWQNSLTEFTYRVQYTSIRHSKLAWKKNLKPRGLRKSELEGVWERVDQTMRHYLHHYLPQKLHRNRSMLFWNHFLQRVVFLTVNPKLPGGYKK